MNDELDPFGLCNTDLKQPSGLVWTDQHREVVKVEHSDRVSIGRATCHRQGLGACGPTARSPDPHLSTYLDERSPHRNPFSDVEMDTNTGISADMGGCSVLLARKR
ncbi:MAG TPA: hypothetical protein VE487_11325, partial [Ilumatobacter sp.]|nr:hypothetical protein [Ilumatobacter sp.]